MYPRIIVIFPSVAIAQGLRQRMDSEFGEPLEFQEHSAAGEDLILTFLHSIAPIAKETTQFDFVSTYASCFIGKPLEVGVYEHKVSEQESFVKSFAALTLQDFSQPAYVFESLSNGACIFCANEDEAVEVGNVFFWKTIHDKRYFLSDNPHLVESIYLPTQLAKDGIGLFFEERLVQRIFDLGAVPPRAQVLQIKDNGGWGTLDELTASLTALYITDNQEHTVTLLGTALVPSPPVTPESLCLAIEKMTALLTKMGIPSSILRAEKGVVYHKKMTPLLEALKMIEDEKERRGLLFQCAEIAGLLDGDFLGKAVLSKELGPFEWFDQYVEVSNPDDAVIERRFLDALAVDGCRVYWTEFRTGLRPFRGHGTNRGGWCWNTLAEELDENERMDCYSIYFASRNRSHEIAH